MINKLKTMRRDSGFTIVELLIVIVVIGILAAITIVSYTGITQKANTTKAQTNAVAVQKVAEAYFAENGYYPDAKADFSGSTASLPAGITFVAALSSGTADKDKSVVYATNGTAGDASGAQITYWDFTGSGATATPIVLGAQTGTFTAVAN